MSELNGQPAFATVRSRINAVLDAIKPRAVCDGCLFDILHLREHSQVLRVTRFLWGEFGYRREENTCARCGRNEFVVSKR